MNNYLILTLIMAVTMGGVSWINSYLFNRLAPQQDYEGLIQSLGQAEEVTSEQSAVEKYLGKNSYAQIYDDKGNLLYATEVAKKQTLTPEFVKLLATQYNQSSLHGITYTNALGENKLLVIDNPPLDDLAYQRAESWMSYSWLILAGMYVLLVSLSIYWLNKKTKSLLRPLSESISSMITKSPVHIEYRGPKEFVDLYDEFNILSERLDRSEKEREKLDAGRNKMLADISHDLRTPITVIQGYAHALYNDVVPSEEKDQYLQTIYQKTVHLDRLIDAFFEFSQLNHPHLILHKKTLDLVEFMQDYLAEKYQEIALAGFTLDVSIPEEETFFRHIDPLQLRRAFDNLLSNSLKFNPAGTKIYFSIEQKEQLEIVLADDGQGIPKHLKSKLFDPFAVGDEARGKNGGTGLGLAITQRILELHSGTIELVEPPEKPYKTQFLMKL